MTNDSESAGCTAKVAITICGHKADTGPIMLGEADGTSFQAGYIDEFDVSHKQKHAVGLI